MDAEQIDDQIDLDDVELGGYILESETEAFVEAVLALKNIYSKYGTGDSYVSQCIREAAREALARFKVAL